MKTKVFRLMALLFALVMLTTSLTSFAADSYDEKSIETLVKKLREYEKVTGADLSNDIAKLQSGDNDKIKQVITKYSSQNKNAFKEDLEKRSCAMKESDCSFNTCCSGLACIPNQGLSTFKIDGTDKLCGNYKAKCKEDGECCSKSCSEIDKKTGFGQCQLVNLCLPIIKSGEECVPRKTYCETGRCLPHDLDPFRVGACQPAGVECTKNDDCCSEKCDNNLCVNVYKCEKCAPAGKKIDKSKKEKCCDGYYENEEGFCRPNVPPLPPITSQILKSIFNLFISSAHAEGSGDSCSSTCPTPSSCSYGVKGTTTVQYCGMTCPENDCYSRAEVEQMCAAKGAGYHYRDELNACYNEKEYCENLKKRNDRDAPYKDDPMAYPTAYDEKNDKCLTNSDACENATAGLNGRWCYTIKDGRHNNGTSCERPVLNINGRERCVLLQFESKRDKTTWEIHNRTKTESMVGGNMDTLTASISVAGSIPDQCRFNTKGDMISLMTGSERHYYYMLLAFEFIANNPKGLRDYYRQETPWDKLDVTATGSVYDMVVSKTGLLLKKDVSPHKPDNPELSIRGRLYNVAAEMQTRRLDLEVKMVTMDRQVTCDCVSIKGYENVPKDIQDWYTSNVSASDMLYGRLPVGAKDSIKGMIGTPNCENAGLEIATKTGADQAYTASLKFYPMLLNYYIAKRKMLQGFLEANLGFSSKMIPIANYLGISKSGNLAYHNNDANDFLEDGPWGVVKEAEQWGWNHTYVDKQHPIYPWDGCAVMAALQAIGTAILAVFAFVFEVIVGLMMFIPNIFSMVGGDGALFNSGDIFNAFFYGSRDPTCKDSGRTQEGSWQCGFRIESCGWFCLRFPPVYERYKVYDCEGYGDSPYCGAQIPPKMCVMTAYTVTPQVGSLAGLSIPPEEYQECHTEQRASTGGGDGSGDGTESVEVCETKTREGKGWLVDPLIPEGAEGNYSYAIDPAQNWIKQTNPPSNAVTQTRIDKVKELALKFINDNRVLLNEELPATAQAATSTKAKEAFTMAYKLADHMVNYHFLYPSINVKYPSNPATGFVSYVDMVIYSMDNYVRHAVNAKSIEEDDLRFKTLLESYKDACDKFGGSKGEVAGRVLQGNAGLSAAMNKLQEQDGAQANPCTSEKGKLKPEYLRKSYVIASEPLKRFVGEGISPEYAEFAKAGDTLGIGGTGDGSFGSADLSYYEKAGKSAAARDRERSKTYSYYMNTVGKTALGEKMVEARSSFINKMTSTVSDSQIGDSMYNKSSSSTSSSSRSQGRNADVTQAANKASSLDINTSKKNVIELNPVAAATTATTNEMDIDLSDLNLDDLGLSGKELSFGKGQDAQTYLEMVNGLNKNKKKYEANDTDGLFDIVSKAYVRSIPKLLVKKKKAKNIEEEGASKSDDAKKNDIKKLLNNF